MYMILHGGIQEWSSRQQLLWVSLLLQLSYPLLDSRLLDQQLDHSLRVGCHQLELSKRGRFTVASNLLQWEELMPQQSTVQQALLLEPQHGDGTGYSADLPTIQQTNLPTIQQTNLPAIQQTNLPAIQQTNLLLALTSRFELFSTPFLCWV
jgi:hypothetical protein